MYLYKDTKGFFDNQPDLSLSELFSFTNEIEYVTNKDNKLYKYTYKTMCCDLTNRYSWSRLPTQLMCMVISKLLNVNISIINDSNTYITNINETDKSHSVRDVYIGHIGECHYIPLDLLNSSGNTSKEVPQYKESKIEFFKWAYNVKPRVSPKKGVILEMNI